MLAFVTCLCQLSAAKLPIDNYLATNLWVNYYESKFSPAPKKEQGNKAQLKENVNAYLTAQPVKFLENKGQMMDVNNKPVPFVLFKAESHGVNAYITEKGLTYVFEKVEKTENENHKREIDTVNGRFGPIDEKEEIKKRKMEMAWVNVNLEGANIQRSNIVKEGQSTEHFNYFYGHCPEGIYDVNQYDKITIKEVYPGIDWVLYNSQKGGMKYDFIVHPGADPSKIKMLYEGENALKLEEDGSIDMQTQLGMFTEAKPYSYIEGSANEIKSAYKLTTISKHQTRLEFNLGQHNQNSTLIIDPQLVWATYYGGSNIEVSSGFASDATGNIFASGYTTSTNFPILNAGTYFQTSFAGGWGDAFILKFNNSGVLLWGTYYGGNNNDYPNSIACDNSGNVFITGATNSTNFPVFNPGGGAYFQGALAGTNGSDIFILKFSNTGLRLWATYYGGSISATWGPGQGYTRSWSLTCDNSGNVFVTGDTDASNFPVLNPGGGAYFQGVYAGGREDAFILKFSNSGVRLWATYYGGNGLGNAGLDQASSIDCDNSGNVFVAGITYSNSFPVLNAGSFFQGANAGGADGFILKFNNSGVLLWATYYGGSGHDACVAIACDNNGNVYASGVTTSSNLPLQNIPGAYNQLLNGGITDALILKFDNAGNRLWATYYGGSGLETASGDGHSIVFDACQNVYISLCTTSNNTPTQFYQAGCGGFNVNTTNAGSFYTGFLLKFTNTGQRLWATYFGPNTTNSNNTWCYPIVCDVNNNIFISIDNYTSSGYPLVNPGGGAYYNGIFNGVSDAYFMKFVPIPPTYTKTQTNPTTCACNGVATISVTCGDAPYTYQWSNAVTVSNTTLTTHSISGLCPGVYQVTVTSCPNYSYTTSYTLTGAVSNLTVNAMVQNANCISPTGSVIINSVTNGVPNYTLAEGATTVAAGFNTPYTLSNVSVGTHTYVLTIANGCATSFIVTITQNTVQPNISIINQPTLTCLTTNAVLQGTSAPIGVTYSWVPQNVTTNTALVTSPGNYTFIVTNPLNGCTSTSVVTVLQNTTVPVITSAIASNSLNCVNTNATLTAISAGNTIVWNGGVLINAVNPALVNAAGNYTATATNPINGCTSTSVVAVLQNTTVPVITSAIASNSLTCVNTNATLTATSAGNTIVWNGGSLTNAANPAVVNAAGNYTATATYSLNGCSNSMVVTVTSVPIFTAGASLINDKLIGCAPVCVSFSLTQNQNSNYNYNWVFTSSAPSPTVITSNKYDPLICFTKEGVYNAQLVITSVEGCSTAINYTNLITVYEKPIADFYFTPEKPEIIENSEVSFINLSQGASTYQWFNVNTLFSQQKDPKYMFTDPGNFLVSLIASNAKCSDTISKYVRVEDGFFLYIPNSFSPNDDVINDYFFPVITGDFSPKNYSFEIFDRWGELLYRSNNPYETKWNGCYKGEICKDDVYVWKLNIQNLKGTIQKNAGHVTLMK